MNALTDCQTDPRIGIVLVLARPDDGLADAVAASAGRAGRTVARVTPDEAAGSALSWWTDPGSGPGHAVLRLPGVPDGPLGPILLRTLTFCGDDPGETGGDRYLATERHEAFLALFAQADGPVVNRPSLVRPARAVYGPPGLFTAARNTGLPLADAALTTSADTVTRFAAAHPAGVLVRDLVTGAVRPLTSSAPEVVTEGGVLLTERFTARALRVFVAGPDVVAERSRRVWRSDDDETIRGQDDFEPFRPDPFFADRCRALAGDLGLTLAGLVFAQTDDGPVLCAATALPELDSAAPETARDVTSGLLDVLTGGQR